MRKELEQRIVDRWPAWFDVEGDTRTTLMRFGFAHDDGWFDIVWRLCEQLEPLVADAEKETGPQFQVLQVKNKFGGLRFYPKFSSVAISVIIDAAELESFLICEICGKAGIRRGTTWITTRCDEHSEAKQEKLL